MELDGTDLAILRALQEDARLSFRELSRRIGVSVPTVSARVARLEELGVLAGYHASVDADRLGQRTVLLFARPREGRTDDVAARLAALDEVRHTVRLEDGRVFAEVVLPRADPVDDLVARVAALDGVAGLEHAVAEERLKEAPRAVVRKGLAARIACFECRTPIEGEPVTIRLNGRTHYLCCPSCETLYRKRYADLARRARARAAR